MADSTALPSGRRRSSIYDPARDLFTATKELPSIQESNPAPLDKTVKEASTNEQPSLSHTTKETISQLPGDMTFNGSRKRSRSRSIGQISERKSTEEPSSKKHRPSSFPGPSPPAAQTTATQDRLKNKTSTTNHERRPDDGPDREPEKPVRSVADIPRIKRIDRDDSSRPIKRPREIPSVYSRRDIDTPRSPNHRRQGDRYSPPFRGSLSPRHRSRSPYRRSPENRRRDPSPRQPRSPSPIRASPPPDGGRVRKRPGGGARINAAAIEDTRRRQAERERETQQAVSSIRGVQDMSNQFYNARPEWVKERGRDWRKNESKIKGLRSFNNWVKSCLIQKFSPDEPAVQEERGWGQEEPDPYSGEETTPLLVLDIGCGKGGDLGKWQLAPQNVGLYVGLDPADQSIAQAQDRYIGMRRGRRPIFDARFIVKDCFSGSISDIPIVQEVGIDISGSGARWRSGGWSIVTSMFSIHYAFENEAKARMMLQNVAGALKKGGRWIGVLPNSDVISSKVVEWHTKRKEQPQPNPTSTPAATEEGEVNDDDEEESAPAPTWGNSIYSVRFSGVTPKDGVFRPATGWKYTYYMEEAVDVPEYVVDFQALRAMAEDYNLELRYRKPFLDMWEDNKEEKTLGPLAVRMGVTRDLGGRLEMSAEEREAVGFYHGFCFTKV